MCVCQACNICVNVPPVKKGLVPTKIDTLLTRFAWLLDVHSVKSWLYSSLYDVHLIILVPLTCHEIRELKLLLLIAWWNHMVYGKCLPWYTWYLVCVKRLPIESREFCNYLLFLSSFTFGTSCRSSLSSLLSSSTTALCVVWVNEWKRFSLCYDNHNNNMMIWKITVMIILNPTPLHIAKTKKNESCNDRKNNKTIKRFNTLEKLDACI